MEQCISLIALAIYVLNHEKDDCEIFIKIWVKNDSSEIFNYRVAQFVYIPCFRGGIRGPTPLSGSYSPRLWMKNNWLKIKSTGSRVLLVNVSVSDLISEFSTYFLLRFWYKFHRHLFSWFLPFYDFLSIVKDKRSYVWNFSK